MFREIVISILQVLVRVVRVSVITFLATWPVSLPILVGGAGGWILGAAAVSRLIVLSPPFTHDALSWLRLGFVILGIIAGFKVMGFFAFLRK